MAGFIFLISWDFISKISNPYALLAFLALIIYLFYRSHQSTPLSNNTLFLFSGSILVLAIICIFGHYLNHSKIQDELKDCVNEKKTLQKEKENLFASSEKWQTLKDTFNYEKRQLKKDIDSLTQARNYWEQKYRERNTESQKLSQELKKHKSYQYSFKEDFAALRDPSTGMWGFLRKGQSRSDVDFIYKEACNFSNGRAGVKYNSDKWGFVDKSLGPPIINCIFETAYAFYNGRAKVKYKGKWIYIDKKGDKITSGDATVSNR